MGVKVLAGSNSSWFPLPHAWRAHAIHTPGSILLETAGGLGDDHVSYLFTAPEKMLYATSRDELLSLLDDVEAATNAGFYAAGRIDYEAAYALHNIPSTMPPRTIARFGIYREPLRFDHHSGIASGPAFLSISQPPGLNIAPILSPLRMGIDRQTYAEKFAAVQRFLAAGDTYQVNLTTCVYADLIGSQLALYDTLIDAQPVDYAAILHLDDDLTLCFSPELFFRTEHVGAAQHIVARPMKGTAPRGRTPEEDAQQNVWLARDEKNRAEHVMIVDLLRNDLGRICQPGSVRTDKLFHVEPYPTLFQMTSTISGQLQPNTGLREIIPALFPSGSITGAPKRRTMELIRDLEDGPRGVYTGAIGFVTPAGDTCFNVPIRTLDVRSNHVSMGVGGGVVADSTAQAEYDECVLKASFLNRASTLPQLIETLLWNNGYPMLDLHIARLSRSAAQLGFACDTTAIISALKTASSQFKEEQRIRLLLSADGAFTVESGAITGPRSDLRVRLAARRILSTDPWLQHKTTRRAFYDREFARARFDGFDEIIFLNERDELAEGAISTLFVEIDGRLYTPPLNAGALPGVFRQHLFQTHPNIAEKKLRLEDLASASAAYVGNAVRGLRTLGSFHIE